MVNTKGGKVHQRTLATKTVAWCFDEFTLENVQILVLVKNLKDCFGYCERKTQNYFVIGIDQNQTIREFVATLIHEMIHVKQYVHNNWSGDGEEEAWANQNILADKMWANNLI